MRLLSLALLMLTLGCNGEPVATNTAAAPDQTKANPAPSESPSSSAENPTPEPGKPIDPVTQKQPSPPVPQELLSASRSYPLKDLKTTKLEFNGRKITAWIMDTPSKRSEGMMFLSEKEVKADESMIFVFPDEEPRSFWMRNTLIPLDIAYLDRRGKAVSVHTMKAFDESGMPSKGPAMYALEMKAGAFKRLGIKAGTTFKIPKDVVADE